MTTFCVTAKNHHHHHHSATMPMGYGQMCATHPPGIDQVPGVLRMLCTTRTWTALTTGHAVPATQEPSTIAKRPESPPLRTLVPACIFGMTGEVRPSRCVSPELMTLRNRLSAGTTSCADLLCRVALSRAATDSC